MSRQQRKGRKTVKFIHFWQRKGNEVHVNLPKSDKSLANRHEAELPVQILQRKGNEVRKNLPKSDNSLANRHKAKLPV